MPAGRGAARRRGACDLECKVSEVVRLKSHNGETLDNYLVIGEVVAFHIDDALIHDGRFDTAGAGRSRAAATRTTRSSTRLIALARPAGGGDALAEDGRCAYDAPNSPGRRDVAAVAGPEALGSSPRCVVWSTHFRGFAWPGLSIPAGHAGRVQRRSAECSARGCKHDRSTSDPLSARHVATWMLGTIGPVIADARCARVDQSPLLLGAYASLSVPVFVRLSLAEAGVAVGSRSASAAAAAPRRGPTPKPPIRDAPGR